MGVEVGIVVYLLMGVLTCVLIPRNKEAKRRGEDLFFRLMYSLGWLVFGALLLASYIGYRFEQGDSRNERESFGEYLIKNSAW